MSRSNPAFEGDMPWSAPPSPQIMVGTVGWEDTDDFFFQGTDENDGYTLIRVQLFQGRDITQPLNPSVGQGKKLLCHISNNGFYRIPPKGTRVWVAVPMGMENLTAAGVIFATAEKNPTIQYNKDRVQMNVGDDVDLVIRAKSVTITDPGNRFILVGTPRGGGTPGLIFQDETGSGGTITAGAVGWWSTSSGAASSMLQITGDAIEMHQTDGAHLTMKAGDFYTIGSNIYNLGAGVYLGAAPSLATTALYGVSGPAGLASTSVFISP